MSPLLVKIVKERRDTLKSRLALVLDFDGELDFRLADATEVLDVVQDCLHAD